MFYGDLYDMWFDKILANKQNTTKIMESFRHGGYYRWDFSEQLTLLSINSIFMNAKDSTNDKAEKD
jgi:hypothetical protein